MANPRSILDPTTALAFAIHAAPGSYALLLGSGVSSATGIPTGWTIVLDLIKRIAATEKKNAGEDPEAWYAKRFGEEPKYAVLLDKLAKTASERQALIRRYIEPSEEQRQAGLRLPTNAHRAIARLVAGGYIRVILTTNFDRLLEQALEEAGVSFDVIDGVDSLRGARPLTQTPCLLIKLHGDYRDARIRNTPAELQTYEPEIDALLDRVLDEHGLLVCGWSAEWDGALRAAITRQPNRRFATYWAARAELAGEAKELVDRRGAVVISNYDAERVFTELEGKIAALSELDRPHPLSVATAIAELKRYLPDPQARIRLDDLLRTETERVVQAISDEQFSTQGPGSTEDVRQRVARYEAIVETLVSLCAIGAYYSSGAEQSRLWGGLVARLANHARSASGLGAYLALRRYPALLCFYAAGVGAVAAENWSVLREIFLGSEFQESGENPVPLVGALHPGLAFRDVDVQAVLYPTYTGGRKYTPISDYLHDLLRVPLKAVVPDEVRYTLAFDRFEFLLGATLSDVDHHRAPSQGYAPNMFVGSFGWRYRHRRGDPAEWLQAEVSKRGEQWSLLKSGLFGSERARLEAALTAVVETTNRRGWGW